MERTTHSTMKIGRAGADRASGAGSYQRTLPVFGDRFHIPGPPM
jgi:hypothetical protein